MTTPPAHHRLIVGQLAQRLARQQVAGARAWTYATQPPCTCLWTNPLAYEMDVWLAALEQLLLPLYRAPHLKQGNALQQALQGLLAPATCDRRPSDRWWTQQVKPMLGLLEQAMSVSVVSVEFVSTAVIPAGMATAARQQCFAGAEGGPLVLALVLFQFLDDTDDVGSPTLVMLLGLQRPAAGGEALPPVLMRQRESGGEGVPATGELPNLGQRLHAHAACLLDFFLLEGDVWRRFLNWPLDELDLLPHFLL